MRIHASITLAAALSVLTVGSGSGLALDESPERLEFALLHEGAVVHIEPDLGAQLALKTVAYFETCHTYASVVGDEPDESSVRQQWEEGIRGTHALLRLPAAVGSADLLIGFSADPGAWPVILRQNDRYVLYAKCDGLDGSLLACDIDEVLPRGAGPPDCDRLREIRRQESKATESTINEGAG